MSYCGKSPPLLRESKTNLASGVVNHEMVRRSSLRERIFSAKRSIDSSHIDAEKYRIMRSSLCHESRWKRMYSLPHP